MAKNKENFLNDFFRATKPVHGESLLRRAYADVVVMEVLGDTQGRRPLKDDQVELADLLSLEKNKGHATRAMQALTALADRHGIGIVLDAVSLGKDDNDPGDYALRQFYKKFGFEGPSSCYEMYRAPKGP